MTVRIVCCNGSCVFVVITPEEYNAIKGLAQSFVEAKQSDVDQWRTEKK